MIRFEMEELEKAQLVPGEAVELAKEREKLVHAQSLFDFAQQACNRLYDEDGAAFEIVGKLQREAEHNARFDPDLEEIAKRLQGLATETQDIAQSLRSWTQASTADPGRIEEVESRLQLLRRLESKYGKPSDDLIEYRQTLVNQEKEMAHQEEDRAGFEKQLQAAFGKLREAGTKLSKERTRSPRNSPPRCKRSSSTSACRKRNWKPAWNRCPWVTTPCHPKSPARAWSISN